MGPTPSVDVVTLTNDPKSLNGCNDSSVGDISIALHTDSIVIGNKNSVVGGTGIVNLSGIGENILNQDVIPSQTTLVSGIKRKFCYIHKINVGFVFSPLKWNSISNAFQTLVNKKK